MLGEKLSEHRGILVGDGGPNCDSTPAGRRRPAATE